MCSHTHASASTGARAYARPRACTGTSAYAIAGVLITISCIKRILAFYPRYVED